MPAKAPWALDRRLEGQRQLLFLRLILHVKLAMNTVSNHNYYVPVKEKFNELFEFVTFLIFLQYCVILIFSD